jgi:hypothetical protein
MNILTTARAEALFASWHDPSEPMSAVEIATVVRETVRRLGVLGCACAVAAEFGDHPDVAAARMAWAVATVAATWPDRKACAS